MHRLSRTGWIVVGLVVGAIAIPGLAVAATATIVNIKGNDQTAYVTPAHQLRSAPTDPSQYRFLTGSASSGNCVDLGLPAGDGSHAFVVAHVDIDTTLVGSSGIVVSVLSAGATCSTKQLAVGNVEQIGPHEYDLTPGVSVPAGTHLRFAALGGDAVVSVTGYAVPAGAVPASAETIRATGPLRLSASRR